MVIKRERVITVFDSGKKKYGNWKLINIERL